MSFSRFHELKPENLPYRAVLPPSAAKVAPVLKDALSDAINTITWAISSGLPTRLSGTVETKPAFRSSVPVNRIDEGIGPSRSSLRYGPQQTAGSLRTTPQSKTEDGPMQSLYVGLDVHSRESVFVVENDAGAIVARGSVPTTVNGLKHLRDSCSLPATTGITLETGTAARCSETTGNGSGCRSDRRAY